MDQVLGELRIVLVVVCAAGVLLAAGLGWFASRRLMSPIARVTEAARHIGETEDLGERIDVRGTDEASELARRFNAMLDTLAASRDALNRSLHAQRQLVADASHELRTPITSLRTNIEVLLDGERLSASERLRLLHDVVDQTEELGTLVADVIELARGEQPAGDADEVRLDRLVEEAIARARRHAPGVTFEAALEPVVLTGIPELLARAVNNLLDNAAKHTRPGERVEVTVARDGLTVRDHGPGIPAADLPQIFDRFYRGVDARAKSGSGLGLAIVRQVAESHGGTVTAENASDGGAVLRLRLPTATPALGESPGFADPASVRGA